VSHAATLTPPSRTGKKKKNKTPRGRESGERERGRFDWGAIASARFWHGFGGELVIFGWAQCLAPGETIAGTFERVLAVLSARQKVLREAPHGFLVEKG
jgi:hypothetical protein